MSMTSLPSQSSQAEPLPSYQLAPINTNNGSHSCENDKDSDNRAAKSSTRRTMDAETLKILREALQIPSLAQAASLILKVENQSDIN
eukprot:13285770-Ditylum_brightwellii.AAC.1